MEWPNDKILLLIDEYRKRPLLWDSSHKFYKLYNRKIEAWSELASIFQTDIYEVKRKINSLLASYRRERQKIQNSAEGEVYTSGWFAFKRMSFLMDKNTARKISYTIDGTDQGENNMENFGIAVTDTDDNVLQNNFIKEEYLEDASLACQAIFKRKREEEKQDHQIIKEFTHSAQAVVTSPPRDEHSVYGEHIGNEIRKMNYHAQCTVKHMINDIIFDAQMGMYDNPQQTGT
ncbi:UNVERIFIED_CONTAM: hypothetical protein RMT77_010683 [Armadillidium vulgare]|uniref:MADF domain-containing protein n=1 Tax=Armadillidium nasatum TaxID=96803 RepID=A0A5N5TAL3_9CRUS|nr:hypothetical protein Anas_10527 [Armadillidium nasatum]RXG60133.1 hypothetical protein Avbf_10178 [Armadillidium vulgare]